MKAWETKWLRMLTRTMKCRSARMSRNAKNLSKNRRRLTIRNWNQEMTHLQPQTSTQITTNTENLKHSFSVDEPSKECDSSEQSQKDSSESSTPAVSPENEEDRDDDWMPVKTKRNKRPNRSVGSAPTNKQNQQLNFKFDSELEAGNS